MADMIATPIMSAGDQPAQIQNQQSGKDWSCASLNSVKAKESEAENQKTSPFDLLLGSLG